MKKIILAAFLGATLGVFTAVKLTGPVLAENNSDKANVYEQLDLFGDIGDDPGSGWDVAGTNNATSLFVNGESITNGSKTATLASSSATGKGSRVSIEEGVYFISGTMAYVASQSLILDKYTNTPNYVIGLSVTESLVESGTDSTLVDNATGTPNFAAPGAHRYKIATALIKESLTAPNTTYLSLIHI